MKLNQYKIWHNLEQHVIHIFKFTLWYCLWFSNFHYTTWAKYISFDHSIKYFMVALHDSWQIKVLLIQYNLALQSTCCETTFSRNGTSLINSLSSGSINQLSIGMPFSNYKTSRRYNLFSFKWFFVFFCQRINLAEENYPSGFRAWISDIEVTM